MLASCAVGTLEFRTALEPVRSRRNKGQFFQGWADGVDFGTKTLAIEEAVQDPMQGQALTVARDSDLTEEQRKENAQVEEKKGQLFEISWDKLVLAVGCYSQTFGTPGVREHAYFLKDVGDARRIRNRLLACFETASLPTTTEAMKKNLLHFAVVGGGPTGIEFSAELHDIIVEDLAKLYPELMQYHRITVYDVADKVLSMFDEKLGKYAMDTFKREGIDIMTSHHVEELREGVPKVLEQSGHVKDNLGCFTIKLKEEGEVGIGMCVWSTGLMMNPFIDKISEASAVSKDALQITDGSNESWQVKKNPKSGAVVTNDRLRVMLQGDGKGDEAKAIMKDVFA